MLTCTLTSCFVRFDAPLQAFRTDEDVDIQKDRDGGFNIGWIDAGEYLRYTVDVEEDGTKHDTKSGFLEQSSYCFL